MPRKTTTSATTALSSPVSNITRVHPNGKSRPFRKNDRKTITISRNNGSSKDKLTIQAKSASCSATCTNSGVAVADLEYTVGTVTQYSILVEIFVPSTSNLEEAQLRFYIDRTIDDTTTLVHCDQNDDDSIKLHINSDKSKK